MRTFDAGQLLLAAASQQLLDFVRRGRAVVVAGVHQRQPRLVGPVLAAETSPVP